MKAKRTVYVDQFTDGVLDPNRPMEYFVKDGGQIIANTTPGCWGPMITPALKGGHEVTKPVYVEGAAVGDAIVIHIEHIHVTSKVTASGNDRPIAGNYTDDAFVDAKCPNCGLINPETEIIGIGNTAIRCTNCKEPFLPFEFTHAYTMAIDNDHQLGLTLDQTNAEKVAADSREYMKVPENSIQNPIVTLAPHDMVGTIARMRPFLGQLGTTPAIPFPDSHNAGDFAQALIGASHDLSKTEADLFHRTDGHMDINLVREGAILIAPVKVEGGGVYLGDMHAMQGNGEIAGHTTDVSGIVQLRVEVIKDANMEGPILLPVAADLPHLAKPYTPTEIKNAQDIAAQWGNIEIEENYPVTFIGTGANLNLAVDNGLARAAKLFDVTVPEIMNRCTVTGSIDIGRYPGVATITFLAPKKYLEHAKILGPVLSQYA